MGTYPSVAHTSGHEYFISLESLITGQGQNHEELLIGRLVVFNQQHLNKWEQRIQRLTKGDHKYHKYMLLPRKWTMVEKNYCGVSETIEIQYDAFSNLFSTEMENRKRKLTYLQEGQFWYLINALSEVSYECYRLKEQVGNVKPSNIFMNNLGNIKVLTCFSIPTPIEPYYLFMPNNQSYLSPEQLQGRRKCQMQNMSNKIKSQSFSIGMTLLSIALLHDLFHLYDYSKNQLNNELIDQYLQNLDTVQYYNSINMTFQKYSQDLKNVIRGLLELKVDKRITSLQIYNRLQPHMNNIIEMSPFELGKIQPEQQNTENKKFDNPISIISPTKSIISLCSRKKKKIDVHTIVESIPINKMPVSSQLLDESKVQRLGESKYIGMSHFFPEQKPEYGGVQFLKQLDQKLKTSQKLFPS